MKGSHMEQNDFLKKFSAGLFFLFCVALIVGVVFVIGVEKGITEKKFPITVLFNKVGGLTAGSPVRLSGVTVGVVANIDFLDEEVAGRGVKVDLNLYKKFQKQLYKSTRFAIITEGVLGEKIIEITTSPGFRRADITTPIIGEDPLDVQNLAETFGDAAVSLLEASKSIQGIINEVRDISAATKRLLNRIEQRVIEGNLFKVF